MTMTVETIAMRPAAVTPAPAHSSSVTAVGAFLSTGLVMGTTTVEITVMRPMPTAPTRPLDLLVAATQMNFSADWMDCAFPFGGAVMETQTVWTPVMRRTVKGSHMSVTPMSSLAAKIQDGVSARRGYVTGTVIV